MSELAPGSVSLEDDNPSLESLSAPPAAPDTPAETPQTPSPPEDADPEGTVVNPGGEKLVPLSAVADLRGKVRESKSALEAKEAELAALRDKATKYDQVAGEWQAAQPLIQSLRNGTYQPQTPPRPQVNEKAAQYAKDFDLYKPDGTPDVDRAQRIIDFHAQQAREQAQQLVQPIYQNSAQQQSLYQRELVKQTKTGVTVDPALIDQIWSMVPPELSQRPEIAKILYGQAVAETVMKGGYKPPVTPPPPVVPTESLGGASPAPRELTQADRQMIQAAGIKTKDYEDISSRYKPGERNALE